MAKKAKRTTISVVDEKKKVVHLKMWGDISEGSIVKIKTRFGSVQYGFVLEIADDQKESIGVCYGSPEGEGPYVDEWFNIPRFGRCIRDVVEPEIVVYKINTIRKETE